MHVKPKMIITILHTDNVVVGLGLTWSFIQMMLYSILAFLVQLS